MKKIKSFVIVDSEGLWVTVRQITKNYKFGTYWIKRFSAIKYHIQSQTIINEIDELIELPFFSNMSKRVQKEFLRTKHIHGLDWNMKGIELWKGVKEIEMFCENVDVIFAKGVRNELRLINCYGLCGESIVEKNVNKKILRFDIVDLNGFKDVEKYPEGLVHDSLKECKFFLSEVIRLNVIEQLENKRYRQYLYEQKKKKELLEGTI